jgi:hypothetical protein
LDGHPSKTTPTALQWDSPKVVIFKILPKELDIRLLLRKK